MGRKIRICNLGWEKNNILLIHKRRKSVREAADLTPDFNLDLPEHIGENVIRSK